MTVGMTTPTRPKKVLKFLWTRLPCCKVEVTKNQLLAITDEKLL